MHAELQQLLFAYRMRPHTSAGEFPFYLLYGRDAWLSTESMLEALPSPYAGDTGSYCQELSLRLARVWQNACGAVERAEKQQYGRGADSTPYLVGGRVMVYMPVYWCVQFTVLMHRQYWSAWTTSPMFLKGS